MAVVIKHMTEPLPLPRNVKPDLPEAVEQVMGRITYFRADEDGNHFGIEFLETLREDSHPELTRRLERLC